MPATSPSSAGAQAGGAEAGSVGGLAPGARLWRNRHFLTFWSGQSLSALGDSLATVALPLLVLEATGSVVRQWCARRPNQEARAPALGYRPRVPQSVDDSESRP